jgi:ParB-like nuclease domain
MTTNTPHARIAQPVPDRSPTAVTKLEKYQMLPELPREQFEELKRDIAERGVVVPVIVDEFGAILDGHNRARACRELGINDYPVEIRSGLSEVEKRALARSVNVLRRHLTRDQVRELVGDQLRDTPEWSNNRIAGTLGVDDKTVAAVRNNLAATSEIPKLDRLVGADGKARRQPIRRARRKADADDDWDDDNWDDDVDCRPRRRVDPWNDPTKRAKFDHAIDLIKLGVDPNSKQVDKLLHEGSAFVMKSPPGSYDPFYGRSEVEQRDWILFGWFIGNGSESAFDHVEWLLHRPFQNVEEWLGPEGDRCRANWRMKPVPDKCRKAWAKFHAEHAHMTKEDIDAELKRIRAEHHTREGWS